MKEETKKGKRIVIFSRYNLADQYDLAPEFRDMLYLLSARNEVMHLSFKGFKETADMPPSLTVVEIPVHIDRRSSRSIMIDSMRMYLKLFHAARIIKQFKPDIIFISEILPLVGLFFNLVCRTRVATAYGDWHFHNMLSNRWWSKPVLALAEWVDKLESRRICGFFCRAEAAGERVQRWGTPAEGVRVIRDAPDPDAYSPRNEAVLREKCGFSEKDVVISYHGVMHPGKGLDKLIRWTADLHEELPQLGLLLIGSGPEEQFLRKLAATTAIGNNIYFTGWLETVKEVGDYCNASDINVAMRTKAEANDRVVPGALLHGMACAKLTIAPDLSGCAEIIEHGVNGLLFKADDEQDFKKLIRYIFSNFDSLKPIAEAARKQIVDNYSVSAASRKYAEAIEHFSTL